MIFNECQYKITLAEINKFHKAITDIIDTSTYKGIDSRLIQAERDAIESQLLDLYLEIAEYEQCDKSLTDEESNL